MSTVSTSPPTNLPPDESDPFRYGWRYVTVRAADGTETLDQVPLTLEDVLFPETGDFIVQTDLHDTDTSYLKTFQHRLPGAQDAVAVSDCRVDWNIPGVTSAGRTSRVLRLEAAEGLGDAGRRGRGSPAGPGGRGDIARARARTTLRSSSSSIIGRVPLYVIADVGTRMTEYAAWS